MPSCRRSLAAQQESSETVNPLRLAVLSMHTSPLSTSGEGDGGGMNVYVRELTAALAHGGVDCTLYVRRNDPHSPEEIQVEPGVRVVHVEAGAWGLEKEELPGTVDAYTDGVLADLYASGGVDVIHSHYWLSGMAGHRLKHELDRPLVSTFHTLAKVKRSIGESEIPFREVEEELVVQCADVICANGRIEAEQLVSFYGAPPRRLKVVSPGVSRAFFSPGVQREARRALGLGREPILLFVGRVQPLKGLDLAVETLGKLKNPDVRLLVVGGPSGRAGKDHMALVRRRCEEARNCDRVIFYGPQPHHLLATYYRAADVVLVPSRSESFGLVALEAAACGTPVVAAEVGGLKALVRHGRTGFLIESRDPELWARRIQEILEDRPLAKAMAAEAPRVAAEYSWEATARRLQDEYEKLRHSNLVECAA